MHLLWRKSLCVKVPRRASRQEELVFCDFKNSDNSNSAAPKRRKTATVLENSTEDSTPQEKADGSDEESKTGNSPPRGGRSRNKGPKKQMLNATRRPNIKAGEKNHVADGADGVVEIAGVEGTYVFDGGCDRATITKAYAEKIAKAGVVVHYHKKPKCATLADGSKRPIIIGYVYANMTLITGAGIVQLSNVYIDIIDGEDEGNLMLIGKVEERSLGLKSFAEQLRELAKKTKGKRKVRFAAPKAKADPYMELIEDEVKAAYITGTSIRTKGSSSAELDMLGLDWELVNSQTDGHCFIGEANWQAGIATKIY